MNIYGWPGQVAHTDGCELPPVFSFLFREILLFKSLCFECRWRYFSTRCFVTKTRENRALTFWSGNRFPLQDRLGTQASGQFSKLETKPKTAFLAAKRRPRMTKRWHRFEKTRGFAPPQIKTTKRFYQDRLRTDEKKKPRSLTKTGSG
jgi:hypothetical protein